MTGSPALARMLHMGGAVVDYVYRVAELPPRGGEAVAATYARLPGGGVNQMTAARRSGLAVAYGGGHGSGPDGALLRAALRDLEIEVLQPANRTVDSGNCVVMVDDSGERSFVSWPGAEGRLDPAALTAIQVRPTDWIALSGYTLSYADSRNVLSDWLQALPPDPPVIFDPAPVVAAIPPDLCERVLLRATWVSANLVEAQVLTGEEQPSRQATALLERLSPRAQGVLLRAGAAGCHLQLRGKAPSHLPAFAVDTIDTNGAGDTHLGVFIACLAQGHAPETAALRANAAAAIAVTRAGGASAPTAQEIDLFLAKRQNDRSDEKAGNA
ncbi:PfkB family carbohydrate kinase [Pelagibius sp. CAU 1746]|uniref:PfkB family carbohydrate kinase n=1 Tax=Pelagibius sp. CAU 1746 TaxID=3140370 RepID=UPI00325BC81C